MPCLLAVLEYACLIVEPWHLPVDDSDTDGVRARRDIPMVHDGLLPKRCSMKSLPAGPLPAFRNHLLLACTECNQCAPWRLRDGKNGVSGTGSFGDAQGSCRVIIAVLRLAAARPSAPTSCYSRTATTSFLQMHLLSAFLISLQGVSEVCLRALRTRKPSSTTISSWWLNRARIRPFKRWQPIPRCSSCSVAAARFWDA